MCKFIAGLLPTLTDAARKDSIAGEVRHPLGCRVLTA